MISTALALLKTDEQRNVLSEFYQKYKNRFYAIAYSKLHGFFENCRQTGKFF